VELQLDLAVEVNAQGVIVAVTHRVPRSFRQKAARNAGFSREKAQTPCRNDRAIWEIRDQSVSDKAQTISARLDVGLQRASAANQNVGRAIERARADVATVSKESADLGGGGEKGRRASRALRTVLQQQAGPNIDDLGGRLATLSDAAVVVSSLLESFQEVPTGPRIRVEPDLLKRRADEAQQLAASLRRLEAALGDGETGTSSREVAATASEVERVLEKCQVAVDGWQSDLDAAREDLARVKAQPVSWLD
jgi:hypothetical protein